MSKLIEGRAVMAKVVIVTGGSGGLGGEVAIQFALTGAKVLVHYHSGKNDADIVASKIKNNGGEALVYQADVCNFDQVKAMAEFATIIPFDESSQEQIKKQVKESSDKEKAIDIFKKLARDVYEAREKQMGPELMGQIEKIILLSTIDTLWTSHLEDISDLREGIGLRGYAARDPLVEYKSEAFNLFESLVNSIDYEVVHRIFKVQLAPQEQQGRPHQHEHATTQTSTSSSEAVSSKIGSTPVEAQPVPSIKKKIGRNDPCPCGSGLKYKKCGLINSPSHKG